MLTLSEIAIEKERKKKSKTHKLCYRKYISVVFLEFVLLCFVLSQNIFFYPYLMIAKEKAKIARSWSPYTDYL